MPAPLVFFDIAGPDAEAQNRFYAQVFGWTSKGSQLTAPVVSPLPGSLRTDPADKVLYLGVEDVTAALADVVTHGGTVDTPRFEVPGVVVLGLFRDPAGNRMGLVELAGGKPKIP